MSHLYSPSMQPSFSPPLIICHHHLHHPTPPLSPDWLREIPTPSYLILKILFFPQALALKSLLPTFCQRSNNIKISHLTSTGSSPRSTGSVDWLISIANKEWAVLLTVLEGGSSKDSIKGLRRCYSDQDCWSQWTHLLNPPTLELALSQVCIKLALGNRVQISDQVG